MSITVRAPAVIYVKLFVWITLLLTVSIFFCLFVLPVDVLTPALELQRHEYSPNKGNGCEEKMTNTVQLYDAEAAHCLDAGLCFEGFEV